ncbi:helix-turn-helix transcriptional regulator [Collimonas sp.]|jgi:prophage regulatory protein|uniref:helix-turn-helix transcriptional regulator n=1 Tax=Collimonas sp. TaxID=1963772 RepID=UPI002C4F9A2C|nr:AlpA family phage regulatory protein [Collimonas sp.]HWW07996.1 AlpA family phage regulatory protein [Collimonas sp.]
MQQQQSTNPLWRLPTVVAQTGLSKSEIYRRINNGTFPKPLKLGARAVAWPAAAIDTWVKSLIQGAAQ